MVTPIVRFVVAAALAFSKQFQRSSLSTRVSFSELLLQASSSSTSSSSSKSATTFATKTSENDDPLSLSYLCRLFGASSPIDDDLLYLKTNPQTGIRGVYVNQEIAQNDVLLEIPLKACLRDDSPPTWYAKQQQQQDGEENEDNYAVSVEGWVTRLTASLLDIKYNLSLSSSSSHSNDDEAIQAWLELLPTNLRDLLPIHWDSSMVASADCRALELAVDAAYFARAGPIGDLMLALKEDSSERANRISQRQIEDALDLVQTRACRVESSTMSRDDQNNCGHPLRLLVPIFDLINHDRNHNAEFVRGSTTTDSIQVRALTTIAADSEIFINYGSTSTQPAWKCLFSYGFVPLSSSSTTSDDGSQSEDSVPNVYEDDLAELIVNDKKDPSRNARFEIGPTEIPYELVRFEAIQSGQFHPNDNGGEEDFDFTPEIGQRIVDRILLAAKELDDNNNNDTSSSSNNDGLKKDVSVAASLVGNLRESNRRTLLACAGGLREYLSEL